MSGISRRISSLARIAGLMVLAGSGAMIAASAPADSDNSSSAGAPTAVPDSHAVAAKLAGEISAELAGLPAGATSEDLEAFIVFRLDQGNYSPEVIDQTLTLLGASDASTSLGPVIDNVRLALLKRKKRGTAALINTGGGAGFSGFTSSVSLGGGGAGGSNYGS